MPLPQEVIKEVVEDVYNEKVFSVVKQIEKPKFIPRYVDRYVDKYVDVHVYVPHLVFKEVVTERNVDKLCEVTTTVNRLNIRGVTVPKPMNTYVKREVISDALKRRYDEASRNLAQAIEENVKTRAVLDGLHNYQRAKANSISPKVDQQVISQLRNQIQNLENSIRLKEEEANRLRMQLSQEKPIEQVMNYDREMIPVLQEQIRNIREHNAYLRDLARQGRFHDEVVEVGSEVVGHNVIVGQPRQVVHAGVPLSGSASYYTGSYSGSYSSANSRSVSPVPRVISSGLPPTLARPLVGPVSPRHTQPIRGVPVQNSVFPNVLRKSSPAPQRLVAASPRVVGGPVPLVSQPLPARVTAPVYSRSTSPYSSRGSYSSYSSRSPSPVSARHYASATRLPVPRSPYQAQVDSVVRGYPSSTRPTIPPPVFNDLGGSMRSTYQSLAGGKPFSAASTFNPSTFGNTGKLYGDYSLANKQNWGS